MKQFVVNGRICGQTTHRFFTTIMRRHIQPPYSPNLAPCDFFLFPKLKYPLRGTRHESIQTIKINSILSPFSFTTEHQNSHFHKLIVNFALFIFSATVSRYFKYSLKFVVTTVTSSRLQNILGCEFGVIILSINRWNVAGAFANPNDIHLN